MQLGQTNDPPDLIPGDPGSLTRVAGQLYDYSVLLTEAGNGLRRINTASGWQGTAAHAFHARFHGQPDAWLEAGACFLSAAKALDDYLPVLAWAQAEAGAAIEQWNQGHKEAAQAILANARTRLAAAANTANGIVGAARDKAPHKPGFWSDVGSFLGGLLHGAEHAGATSLDALASLGDSVINNPLADFGMVGGALLAGVSAVGDAGGLVLDATGVGAVAGVPLNALSTTGLAVGTGLMMASGGDLASHAFGDDRVEPVSTGSGEPPPQDPRLTPGTPEYDEYIDELSKDPAKNGTSNAASQREATVAVQTQADGEIPGPLTRTPLANDGLDQGDFTDSTGQRWDVKSSPDFRPSYRLGAGQPINNPQSAGEFTTMINEELAQGQNVLLDPDGMSATRLADLQEIVADHPEWQGRVIWGR